MISPKRDQTSILSSNRRITLSIPASVTLFKMKGATLGVRPLQGFADFLSQNDLVTERLIKTILIFRLSKL